MIGECEPGFEEACEENREKYREWRRRLDILCKNVKSNVKNVGLQKGYSKDYS